MTDYRPLDRAFLTDVRMDCSRTYEHQSITSLEHDTLPGSRVNVHRTDEIPQELNLVAQDGMQQRSDILPQSILSLDEYLITSEDVILASIQAFEKSRIEQFLDGMADEKQRATLAERLDQKGWTWKAAYEEATAISIADRRQEAEERAAAQQARMDAKHEAEQPQPRRTSQRKKRKRNFW